MSDPLYLTGYLRNDKGEQFEIYYFTKRGKERIDHLFEAADLRLDAIQKHGHELEKIQRRIVSIPFSRDFILKFLAKYPESIELRIRIMINWNQDEHYLLDVPFNYAWDELVKEKTIIPTSHGRGHARTWSLNHNRTFDKTRIY